MAEEIDIVLTRVGATFPVGTVVGLYEGILDNAGVQRPTGAKIAEATVQADESLTFADVLAALPVYWAAAQVGGTWKFIQATTKVGSPTETPVESVNGKTGVVVIDAAEILTPGTVGEEELADGAVTTNKVAPEAIDGPRIKNGVISELKMAAKAVKEAALANEAVTALKLAAGAVTKAKLDPGVVEEIEKGGLKEEGVETKHLKNLAVTTGKLAEGAVTALKLAAGAVGSAALAVGAVTTEKIAGEAVTTEKLAAEAIDGPRIKNGSVSNLKIGNKAVTESALGNEAVTEEKLTGGIRTKLKGAVRSVATFALPAGTAVSAETLGQFWQGVAAGETKKLVAMRYTLASGTKAKFSIKQNGAAVTGFKEVEAKSTEVGAVTGKEVAVADGDLFLLVVESIEGTPKGLSVTLVFESTH